METIHKNYPESAIYYYNLMNYYEFVTNICIFDNFLLILHLVSKKDEKHKRRINMLNLRRHTTNEQNRRKPFGMKLSMIAMCAMLLVPLVPAVQALAADEEEIIIEGSVGEPEKEPAVDESKNNDMEDVDKKASSARKEKTIHVTEEIDESLLEDQSHPHYTVHTASGSKRLSDEYQDYTYAMCEKYGIKQYYGVILTQMYCESSYNQNAVSRSSSYGLMQIHSSNFSRLKSTLGLTDLKDPLQNIEAGVYLMADYVEKYGDIQTALVCYHRGEGAARKGMRSDNYSSRIVSLSSGLEAN